MATAELHVFPDREAFLRRCEPGSAVPVSIEIDADTDTPISAFLKLSKGEPRAFLFESVEGGERSGRWSLLGARPRRRFAWSLGDRVDPLAHIEAELASFRKASSPGMPRFSGGLVGYFSYDAVRLFEPRVPIAKPDELGFPDIVFMDFDTVVAFDNLRRSAHVVAEARRPLKGGPDPGALYNDALRRIRRVIRSLSRPLEDPRPPRPRAQSRLVPRVSRADFEAQVRRAREYIKAGDCQQIVLSQRFDASTSMAPFELYRALRRVNPSPYLYFYKDGDRALVGSSPEILVRVSNREITLRPIAGTRARGKDAAEDAARADDLKADPKENAEHMMLVDLGRNDVGRVAEIGSVRVHALREIERYSHVLHMASEVRGLLAPGRSALDALRAAFPAGTVSGAPKVRAMEIIDELEPARRGPYAGCIGYFDRSGDMDMAITIRTLLASKGRVSVQAGAGIVYDSKPASEYQETLNKAGALFAAVAEAGAPRRGAAANGTPPIKRGSR